MRKLLNLRDPAEGLSVHGERPSYRSTLISLRINFQSLIRNARKDHFSNLISTNSNNSRVLFSTIDSLINPAPKVDDSLFSTSKCEEFAAFFRDKITNIRKNIAQEIPNVLFSDPLPPCCNSMSFFALADIEMLSKIVSQLKPSTCPLDPLPTKFLRPSLTLCLRTF